MYQMFSSQPQRPPNQLGTVSTPWPQSLNPWRKNTHLCVGVSLRSLPSCRELAVTDYSPLAREAVRNHKVVGGQPELQQKTQHKEPERWSSLKSTLVVFSMLWRSFLKICNFLPLSGNLLPSCAFNGSYNEKTDIFSSLTHFFALLPCKPTESTNKWQLAHFELG